MHPLARLFSEEDIVRVDRAVVVFLSLAGLEDLFINELARLQPTAGVMRLVKDRVLHVWREIKADAKRRITEIERKQKAIREKR